MPTLRVSDPDLVVSCVFAWIHIRIQFSNFSGSLGWLLQNMTGQSQTGSATLIMLMWLLLEEKIFYIDSKVYFSIEYLLKKQLDNILLNTVTRSMLIIKENIRKYLWYLHSPVLPALKDSLSEALKRHVLQQIAVSGQNELRIRNIVIRKALWPHQFKFVRPPVHSFIRLFTTQRVVNDIKCVLCVSSRLLRHRSSSH